MATSVADAQQATVLRLTRFSRATEDALTEECERLERFGRRFEFIASVHASLVKTARGKPFYAGNFELYSAIRGEREMLVVDLASWAKGICSRGGFLRRIKGNDLKALGRTWTEPAPRSSSYSLTEEDDADRARAFQRLFPVASGDCPTEKDLSFLCWRLREEEFEALREDRNNYRAHKYEYDRKRVNAAELDIEGLGRHVQMCVRLIRDIRFLSAYASWGGWEVRPDPNRAEARDVVDLILLGTIGWMTVFGPLVGVAPHPNGYDAKRDAYFDALHATHDARGGGEPAFNDPSAELPKRV